MGKLIVNEQIGMCELRKKNEKNKKPLKDN